MYAPPCLKFIQRQRQGLRDIDLAPATFHRSGLYWRPSARHAGEAHRGSTAESREAGCDNSAALLKNKEWIKKKPFGLSDSPTHWLESICDPLPWNVLLLVATTPPPETGWLLTCSRNTYVFRCARVFWIVPPQLSEIWSCFELPLQSSCLGVQCCL